MPEVPEELREIASALYSGATVPAVDRLTEALGRRSTPASAPRLQGAVGQWRDDAVATLVAGEDVTLLTRADGMWRVVGGWWPSLGIAEPQLGGRRHVLAIGSDARPHEEVDRCRADVLQIIGVNGTGGAGVLGVPRDLWVPLYRGGTNKINAAMVFGGPGAQQKTVAAASGIDIEGYLLVGFEQFKKIINFGMGGAIEVDNPTTVPNTVTLKGFSIPKGIVRLTGNQALAWARERKNHPDGDFGRNFNQGLLLKVFAMYAKTQGPLKLPAFMSSMQGVVKTNLSAEQLITLGAWVFKLNPAEVRNKTARGAFGTRSGASVVEFDASVKNAFADMADGVLDS